MNGIRSKNAYTLLMRINVMVCAYLKEAIDVWHLTLKKSGCSKLLTAGLTGLYEAVVLSVFALQFSEHHLALRAQPTFFHRNYTSPADLTKIIYSQLRLNNDDNNNNNEEFRTTYVQGS